MNGITQNRLSEIVEDNSAFDFICRNAAKHIAVEFENADREKHQIELQEHCKTYVDKLKKILFAQGVSSPDIEEVFVNGKSLGDEKDNPDRVKASMAAISPGSRIVHFDALIVGAQNSYSEYLERSKSLDRLGSIVDRV